MFKCRHVSPPISCIPTQVPRILALIARIPAMIFRISILILHIPTMITRIPIIFFIPFPDSPSRLLQIAKNIAKSLSKKQKADVISCCQH